MGKRLFLSVLFALSVGMPAWAILIGGGPMGDSTIYVTPPVRTLLVLTQGGSPVFDTTTEKFGAASLSSGGYGSSSVFLPWGFPGTIQAWVKCASPPAANSYMVSTDNGTSQRVQIAVNTSTGYASFAYDSAGGQVSYIQTTNMCDSNWHLLELDLMQTSANMFIDGVLVKNLALAPNTNQGKYFAVGARARTFSNITTVDTDEVSIWAYVLHPTGASYSVPAAPYTGQEWGLLYLYHLDSNFNNSRPKT